MPFFAHIPVDLTIHPGLVATFIYPLLEAARRDSIQNIVHVYVSCSTNAVGALEYQVNVTCSPMLNEYFELNAAMDNWIVGGKTTVSEQ